MISRELEWITVERYDHFVACASSMGMGFRITENSVEWSNHDTLFEDGERFRKTTASSIEDAKAFCQLILDHHMAKHLSYEVLEFLRYEGGFRLTAGLKHTIDTALKEIAQAPRT